MTRILQSALFTLALAAVVVVSPAIAADAAGTACAVDAAPTAAPLWLAGGPADPSQQTTCNAQCANGSYITCWGSSCSATDTQCSSGGPNGSCWGSSTGSRSCGSCPPNGTCSASATCNGSPSVSCSGNSGDCFAVDGCYAYCDSQWNWCTYPDEPCPL